MKLRTFTALSLGREYEDAEITCTKEEYEILRKSLELVGVNVGTCTYSGDGTRTIYFANEYKCCISGHDREFANRMFERNKKNL